WMESYVGNDADTEPESDIRLDDVRVACSQRHIRGQSRLGESLVQGGRAGEAENVGHDRIRGQLLDRRLRKGGQRMPLRHDNTPMPAVARQKDVLAEQRLGSGRHGEVGAVGLGHLGELLRRPLVEMELYVGIALPESLDDRGQHVTRLGVRGTNGQRSARLVLEVGGDAFDILRLTQQLQAVPDDTLAGRGDPGERAPSTYEYVEPELVFEELELLAHRGLCRTQFGRGGRNIEVVLRDGREKPELLYLHRHGV